MSRISFMSKLVNFFIKLNILLFSFSVFNIYATTKSSIDYKTLFESFVIPGHGVLTMNVPKIWNYNFTTTGIDQPPIITFYNLDKDKEEIYQLFFGKMVSSEIFFRLNIYIL